MRDKGTAFEKVSIEDFLFGYLIGGEKGFLDKFDLFIEMIVD
uniref:Uncharacterized protein n=1 Tax=Candidatus Kentrum sp. LFY TaxID=2126342 RepID=A0A450UF11_9GAMM|nr:MAG: hypothetical protein BECKLFY1418B_GA0070995_10243 [Candidatus Kentron sp. LFY]